MEIRRINNGKIFCFGNEVIPKYSFNAKELDEETGMYYFEARYYRAPTFTSRDPLFEKYFWMSPYAYCANNPVKYVDPTGGFPISAHKNITSTAMSNAGLNSSTTKLFRASLMYGVGIRADIIGMASDYHFDGRQNFSQVQSTWNQLNARINGIIDNIGSVNINMGGHDVVALGKELHTVADFYAHSNYVDLYVDYYKSNNNGNMPTTVPTYEEGLQDAGFNDILKGNLRTGDFNLFDNEYTNPNGKRAQSPTSHNKMNKDNVNTPLGRLAKEVAIKHTIKIFNRLKEKIND